MPLSAMRRGVGANKRRRWRKLHLGIDGHGYIIASAPTDSGEDDAAVGISMLEQVKDAIAQFTADGAYDTRSMYEALATSGAADIRFVIPPKKTATVDSRATGPWCQRNHAIERIDEVGRRQWRKESGAHLQAHAENGMYRYKRIIGDRLRTRHTRESCNNSMHQRPRAKSKPPGPSLKGAIGLRPEGDGSIHACDPDGAIGAHTAGGSDVNDAGKTPARRRAVVIKEGQVRIEYGN